ncbi:MULTISPECIES: LysR family transcriptional regulator [unclassified Sphingomonas]|uniref:LysR family transcriptional regulator n=1 Tax=Novosphingobium rhizosphaerae TaxID=1551649 RepID=UPI0015C79BEB
MQLTHVRTSDLNLLLAALVLFEERKISAAAERFHLSQPAMSRLLQRLRETFGDELLVRGASGYELTPRARQLQEELAVLLPRLDRLIAGPRFDPASARETFRVALTDYAALIVAPPLMARLSAASPGIVLDLQAWSDRAFNDLERGRLDLAFWVDDAPAPLVCAPLFDEDFVCVMDADHPAGDAPLTVERYLDFPHVVIGVLGGKQTVIEQRLEALGIHRTIGLRVPFFAAAVLTVPHTPLIATLPRRMARLYASNPAIRLVEPPVALGAFRYIMAWHPRMTGDPAHSWLRQSVEGAIGNST